jgi:Carboxypeptidase regulatory-like domain
MQRMSRYLIVLSFVLLGLSQLSRAQNTYAALHGTVTDSTGSVIPNATVTVLNTTTGISTVRQGDSNGYYIFTQLQVGGPYTVTVSASGFENFVSTGLVLNVNDNRGVDAKMTIGAASQTVEVSATALQVETSNTQLQQVATEDQLEEIPLEGRDPAGLQKLEPGVVESSDRFGTFSSNGSQTPQNSYMVNGTDINDGPLQNEGIQINPDALHEENIVTSTINPEFARNSGAVVNQIIKSGGNTFHGSGFEFYRDTFLNNGNYFSQIRPIFHQNLYGGTLGGPIFHNKFFFFVAYQGLRNRTSQTENPSTMDSSQFTGDFTDDANYFTGGADSSGLTTNPIPFNIGGCTAGTTWADCFSSGAVVVPQTEWNPVASALVNKYVPAANTAEGTYTFNAASTDAQDQGIVRLDYTPSDKDTIWASTIVQSSPSTNALSFGGGSFPGFGQHAAEHFKIFSGSYTHTFNSNKLNELRGGYYRLNFPSVIPTPVQSPTSLGFSINPQLALSGIPFMSVGAYFSLGNSYEGPQPRTDTNLTYADNFTWVRGNHSLKVGASFEQFRVHNPFGYLNNGYYYYDGDGLYSSGDPLLDFVMGIPDGYEQANDGFIDAVATETYAYVQDNWKVSPDLTLNLGLSWDVEQPNQDRQFGGLGIVCFQISSTQSKVFPGGPPGLFYNGDPGCNQAGGPTIHYGHFGPRVGFAWSPSSGPSGLIGAAGAHNMSVRGGFGIYYNRDQEEQSLQNLVNPPVFYISHGAADFGGSPAFANPYADVAGNGAETNPFPFTTPAAGSTVDWDIYNELSLSAFDKSYDVPYTYNYNLNIQRALGGNMIAQVGYVGSVSHRLSTWYEGDPITAAGHTSCLANPSCLATPTLIHLFFPQYTADPAIVPGTGGGAIAELPNGLPWFTSIGAQNTEGGSNYNSLQASLIKAPSHGLQFTLGYTYSHALDNASGYESSTGSAGRDYNFVPGFGYLNYGSSDFDARQRLVGSYVYTVPATGFLRDNLLMRELLSGWGIGGVTALQTGFPVGINMGTTRSYWCDASYFGCPDVPETSSFNIAKYNPRSNAATHQYFDTTPFSPEPLGTFGNVTRNFLHGPGFNYTNLSIMKRVPISAENKRFIELRLEAYNAFNHANFAGPSGNFSSPVFGQVTGVDESADPNGDPSPGRSIQLVGKIYF